MTETSPGRLGVPHQELPRRHAGRRREGRHPRHRSGSSRSASTSAWSIPMTLEPQPWDGESRGELQVAGPWIAREYYNDDRVARVVHRRRLAQDRRRRHRRSRGLHPARRPHQGRREVRRRVDQLGRARERDHGAPRGGRGGRDRRSPPEVVRAPARLRGRQREGERSRRRRSSSSSTVGWPSGGCPTTSCSSTRCRRPRSASSRRRTCVTDSRTTSSRPPELVGCRGVAAADGRPERGRGFAASLYPGARRVRG